MQSTANTSLSYAAGTPAAFDDINVFDLLSRGLTEGERLAVADGARGLSVDQLLHCAAVVSKRLRQAGIEQGSTVATLLPQGLEFAIALLGAARVGVCVVPLSSRLKEAELADILVHSGAELAFVADEGPVNYFELLPDIQRKAVKLNRIEAVKADWVPGLLADSRASALPDGPPLSAPLLLMYTSGTTGIPKGCVHTHASISTAIQSVMEMTDGARGSATYVCASLSHMLGLVDGLLLGLAAGSTVYVQDTWSSKECLRRLTLQPADCLVAVPTQLYDLVSEPVARRAVTFELVLTAGAPLQSELADELTKELCRYLMVQYGMTESVALTNTTLAESPPTRGVVGPPSVGGVEIKIVNESGETVERGSPGQVLGRSKTTMQAYHNNEELTREVIDPDGWVQTGDIGVMADNDSVSILGRLKDVIIRGGHNVYPDAVEAALLRHGGISEAAVIGSADPRLGERIVAFVVPAQEAAELDRKSILEVLGDEVSRDLIPDEVVVVEALPRTSTGKLRRDELRPR